MEKANLTLRGQVATLETQAVDAQTQLAQQKGRTAILEKDAADAKAAQQRVEANLATQQERANRAEKNFLELREQVTIRHLTAEQQIALIERIKPLAKEWTFQVSCAAENPEACAFADEIRNIGREAGFGMWSVAKMFPIGNTPPFVGVTITQKEHGALNPLAQIFFESFTQAKLKQTKAQDNGKLEPRHVEILVGSKP